MVTLYFVINYIEQKNKIAIFLSFVSTYHLCHNVVEIARQKLCYPNPNPIDRKNKLSVWVKSVIRVDNGRM